MLWVHTSKSCLNSSCQTYVRACLRACVLLKPLVTQATFEYKFWLALNSSQVVVKLRYAPPHPLFTILSKQVFRQPKQTSKSPGGTGCPLSPEPQASSGHWDSQVCITTACLTSTPCHEASMGHKCPKFDGSLALCQKHALPPPLSTATVLSRTSARPRLGHLSVLGACQDLTLNLMYSSCWEYRCMLSFTFPWGPLSQHASAKGEHHSAFSVLGIKLMQTLCCIQ